MSSVDQATALSSVWGVATGELDPAVVGVGDLSELVMKVPDASVMADLDATVAFGRGDGAGERLSVTGFCWGDASSGCTPLTARPPIEASPGTAGCGGMRTRCIRHPIDVAAELKAPVLGLYGGKDNGIPLADLDAMRAALEQAGKPGRIDVFAESPHAFYADYRPSYREADAKVAWTRCLDFLRG
jgi:carboxymethylenebutenolidase